MQSYPVCVPFLDSSGPRYQACQQTRLQCYPSYHHLSHFRCLQTSSQNVHALLVPPVLVFFRFARARRRHRCSSPRAQLSVVQGDGRIVGGRVKVVFAEVVGFWPSTVVSDDRLDNDELMSEAETRPKKMVTKLRIIQKGNTCDDGYCYRHHTPVKGSMYRKDRSSQHPAFAYLAARTEQHVNGQE